MAGGPLGSTSDLLADVLLGEVAGVIALGFASKESLAELAPLSALEAVVSLTTHIGGLPAVASVVLPVASLAETHGTFVNQNGSHQTFRRAVPPQAGVEPAWKVADILAASLGFDLGLGGIREIRKKMTSRTPGLIQQGVAELSI